MIKTETELPVFYVCEFCGNMVEMITDSGQPLICCGAEMERLQAASTDGSPEKHVPEYETLEHKVRIQIGSVPHPMEEAHHIAWVELVTNKGIHRRYLYPKDSPTVCFALGKNELPIRVYAYCNIHGLWQK